MAMAAIGVAVAPRPRSEEHTSELQSPMRNSYAVFCVKKKRKVKANAANVQSSVNCRVAKILLVKKKPLNALTLERYLGTEPRLKKTTQAHHSTQIHNYQQQYIHKSKIESIQPK